MTINRPCYCTREQVMRATDIKWSAYNVDQIDRGLESAAENIDAHMKRVFYVTYDTRKFDWPNYQYAYPWRLWLQDNELADDATQVLAGTTVIPINQVFFGPWMNQPGPPFTFFELDRSQSAAFGGDSPTPQRSIVVTGPFGYWLKTNAAGNLAAAITDATSTAVQVTNGAAVGVGDTLICGSEQMLVQDRAMVTTGQSQQGLGVSTNVKSDNALLVTDGTKFFRNEIVLLDQERMLIQDVIGNVLVVQRGFDGTVLATHSSATVYSPRTLTVTRGDLGTTAATHTNGTALQIRRVPPLIRDLAIAEASVQSAQELGLYTDPQGEEGGKIAGIASALTERWDEAETAHRRNARLRAI